MANSPLPNTWVVRGSITFLAYAVRRIDDHPEAVSRNLYEAAGFFWSSLEATGGVRSVWSPSRCPSADGAANVGAQV